MQTTFKCFLVLILLFNMINISLAYDPDIELQGELTKARNGDVVAMNRAGELVRAGLYQEKRFKLALSWFESAAKAGNSEALVNIARMHAEGYGFVVNLKKSFFYYQQAALLKNTKAMYELSAAYRNGEGVEMDQDKAMELLRECAALGDSNCTTHLEFL